MPHFYCSSRIKVRYLSTPDSHCTRWRVRCWVYAPRQQKTCRRHVKNLPGGTGAKIPVPLLLFISPWDRGQVSLRQLSYLCKTPVLGGGWGGGGVKISFCESLRRKTFPLWLHTVLVDESWATNSFCSTASTFYRRGHNKKKKSGRLLGRFCSQHPECCRWERVLCSGLQDDLERLQTPFSFIREWGWKSKKLRSRRLRELHGRSANEVSTVNCCCASPPQRQRAEQMASFTTTSCGWRAGNSGGS